MNTFTRQRNKVMTFRKMKAYASVQFVRFLHKDNKVSSTHKIQAYANEMPFRHTAKRELKIAYVSCQLRECQYMELQNYAAIKFGYSIYL